MSRYVGKRVGPAPRAPSGPSRGRLLLLGAGVTLSLVAWGLLVFLAIDLGGRARGGQQEAWAYVGLASVGAVVCLFATLVLGAKVVGLLSPASDPAPHPGPPRVPGGRRAAR